ncbi:MAG TPA: transposase [Bacteroidales bacterium]|nr:transposase [Bacteroidales bacterium]
MEIGQVPAYKRWSNRYSYAFKMEVVEAYQSGQMSQRQITRKYGIGRPTILAWTNRYGNIEVNYYKMREKTPQQEIVELKAALRALNQENVALKYIMDIIKEEYGEEVVKKYLPGLLTKKPARKKTK